MSSSSSWVSRWTHAAGSVIIITGAGSGIGLATAVLAAQQGYVVAAWDISEEGLKKTIELAPEECRSSIHPIIANVSEEHAVQLAMQETVKLGKPRMLVNNAGPVAIGRTAGFLEMSNEALAMVHLPATAFLETQPDQGSAIVNIAALAGTLTGGAAPFAWYCAAKAGIAGLTKQMATSHRGHVRVNSVAPGGPIRTPRNTKYIDEGAFEGILARNPTGRPGSAEELANGIMFLLSPAASYINGHMLVIDGGLSIAE